MSEYLFAYDLGTTGVKAGILAPEGQLLRTTYREYRVVYPGPQWVEQPIDEMWKAQCEATRELFDRAGIKPTDIAAVAVSSQRATFVPVDRQERPMMHFIGWQDKRSIAQCEEMKRLIGPERYYQVTGLPIEPTAAASKILWLKEHAPEVFDNANLFASTQNVHLRQLGIVDAPCDLPDAAYLGLLDVDRLVWSRELLDALGIPEEKMPALAPSCQLVGEVSREAAEATGLAPGTSVVTAGGDLQVAGLGLGIVEPGRVSVGIGTGGGILIYLDHPARHPQIALNCLPHAVPGAWEMEGICLASGAAYKWYRDVLGVQEKVIAYEKGLDAYQILDAKASQVEPGTNSVIVMPSFAGAGAPNWYPKARGVILGLTLDTDKEMLTRAMLEGICLEIRWILESAGGLGTPIEEIRIWGGGAKSSLWNQIAADVYGVPAARTVISEGGLVGAAICAGVGVGIYNDVREGAQALVKVAERYDPNPTTRDRYNEMFDIYKTTYQALVSAGVFERITALTG
jgi:xylulokinase